MPQNISDGKVTCWNCHNSVDNLQLCEICGANLSQGVQSTLPTQNAGQSLGPAGETTLGNLPQMARVFPSSPAVTPAPPPETGQQPQPWQPVALVTPLSSSAVTPATSPGAGQQPQPWQPFASVTPPSSPSGVQGFPTGPSTGWRPPGPLNPANVSTPNDAIDQILAQQSAVNQTNNAMLNQFIAQQTAMNESTKWGAIIFVGFVLLSSLMAFCSLPMMR